MCRIQRTYFGVLSAYRNRSHYSLTKIDCVIFEYLSHKNNNNEYIKNLCHHVGRRSEV